MEEEDRQGGQAFHQEIRVFEFFAAQIGLGFDGFEVKEEEKCGPYCCSFVRH